MRSFCTRRGNVVRRILELGHVRTLQTRVVAGDGSWNAGRGLSAILSFHGLHLGLALDFGFISGSTVRVDGLFSEVVGTAAGCI